VRLRQNEQCQEQIAGVQHGGGDERESQPVVAEHSAKNRPDDKTGAKYAVK
jgi:hypothetical protein